MKDARITLSTLGGMKAGGTRIACVTCYDAAFARLLETVDGIDVLLVGDSLGNVIQGHDTTLPVTVDDMVYHSACVARGNRRALVVADMPFLSYATPAQAVQGAARLMQQGLAHMVKLEGGRERLETVRVLTEQGVPVCGHLGLLPQSVHKLGGYRVQGREQDDARRIVDDALALQDAGAGLLVLECVPAALAGEISRALRIPVIGIGAGAQCDGQVLVLYDLLGITPARGSAPRFVKNFLTGRDGIREAVAAYVDEVRRGVFPAAEHGFK